jgi:hypothetical protein
LHDADHVAVNTEVWGKTVRNTCSNPQTQCMYGSLIFLHLLDWNMGNFSGWKLT